MKKLKKITSHFEHESGYGLNLSFVVNNMMYVEKQRKGLVSTYACRIEYITHSKNN